MSGTRMAIGDATGGMVLAERLLDAHGQVLLPQGAALTEPVLASLRRRGVDHLVVGVAVAQVAQVAQVPQPAATAGQQLARLQRLFRKWPAPPGAQLLRVAVTTYRSGPSP